jgi:hypothetical protein
VIKAVVDEFLETLLQIVDGFVGQRAPDAWAEDSGEVAPFVVAGDIERGVMFVSTNSAGEPCVKFEVESVRYEGGRGCLLHAPIWMSFSTISFGAPWYAAW